MDDVAAIQGARITDAKTSVGETGNLLMSQCYYAASEPDKSVTLAVIEKDPRSADSDPRKFWAETFASTEPGEREDDHEKNQNNTGQGREEKEKKISPKKIDGVGEQAFWSGTRLGGALYVLKNSIIVRVSVGGPDNEQTRIAKSKAIAEKAVSRL